MQVDTIYYAGQGFIYRCPHCQKVDRRPYAEDVNCRFCQRVIDLVQQNTMTTELYSVIQEINYLETGSIIGYSPSMLNESRLAKAAKSVGASIAIVNDPPQKEDKPKKTKEFAGYEIRRYVNSYKVTPKQLANIIQNETHGRRMVEIAASLCMGGATVDELLEDLPNNSLRFEVLNEARMRVIMEDNPVLDNDAKTKLLTDAGYEPEFDSKNRLYVFFGSTVAPECDYYLYWD